MYVKIIMGLKLCVNKTGNVCITLTFRRVHETIVAVKNTCYLFLCVRARLFFRVRVCACFCVGSPARRRVHMRARV